MYAAGPTTRSTNCPLPSSHCAIHYSFGAAGFVRRGDQESHCALFVNMPADCTTERARAEGFPSGLAAMIGFDNDEGHFTSEITTCMSCQNGHAGPSNYQLLPGREGARCRIRQIDIIGPGVFGLHAYKSSRTAGCELDGATIRLDPIPTNELWREWAKDDYEKCRQQTWDCLLKTESSGPTRIAPLRRALDGDDDLYGEEHLSSISVVAEPEPSVFGRVKQGKEEKDWKGGGKADAEDGEEDRQEDMDVSIRL